MIQYIYSGRAYKKLIYFVFLWTCVCFVVFRIATNYASDRRLVYLSGSHAQAQRGLLQNMPLDYATGFVLSVIGTTTTSSKISSPQRENAVDNDEAISSKFLNSEPLVDSSHSLSEQELYSKLANISNLPLAYWAKMGKKPKNKSNNKSCNASFPSVFELDFNNIYWQRLQATNATYYLYGAYFDDRWRGGALANVRILAMIDRISPPPSVCQFWFADITSPVFSNASYVYGWYSKWGNYKDGLLQPFIITCKVPRIKGLAKTLAPDSVSLVEKKCDKASNNLRVINNRPKVKEDFAVCVKGLDFLQEDLSVRLVEWIELLNILGAKKIFLYDLEVHPNISKVLNYYSQKGLVDLTKITLPGNQPNLPGFRHYYLKHKLTNKRQNELIPYNDCLYRNIYSYKYLVLLDIDEVIMPLQHYNWSQLMQQVQIDSLKIKNYTRASYNVRNVYFLDDLGNGEDQMNHTGHEPGIPRYLHMLQHVDRSRNYTKPGQYVKCFHNTERIVSLHNHFPLNCFGSCTTYSINTTLAQLQHYRKDCVGPLKNSCNSDFRVRPVRDTTIWRYKEPLIARTTKVLAKLGFFS